MLDPENHDAIDEFIGARLTAAGHWSSPRESDGVSFIRTIEATPILVRFCGRIYTIDDQKEHNFWVEQELTVEGVRWELHFDTITKSPRHERNAVYALEHPGQFQWRVTLAGTDGG